MIFITSLWPTVINTAFGVASVHQDYKNVARVFQFSRWKYVGRVLIPFSLPYILTGLRLSMGIAWMVIVAAEMLSGGIGIGFFVWDSWNALSLERVISAIVLIGLVGLLLDRLFDLLAKRVAYELLESSALASRFAASRAGVQHRRRSLPGDQQNRSRTSSSGEFVALIGHSGCGKSTLLNIVAGLLRPAAARSCSTASRSSDPGPTGRWSSRTTRCCPGSTSTRTSSWRSTQS